jgi:hypothetical protein
MASVRALFMGPAGVPLVEATGGLLSAFLAALSIRNISLTSARLRLAFGPGKQVWASTPVESSLEVVTMTGYLDSGSMKLSIWAIPAGSLPVMRMT